MKTELWVLMGLTAALLSLLFRYACRWRPDSRGYRLIRRLFWWAVFLWISGSLGGIGLNQVTAAAVLSLGLPGYAALTVLRLL